MRQRVPVILSATALVVAVFGSTPLGEAAREAIPPLAKRAKVADNAKKLGGLPASAFARKGGAGGAQGPAGPKGDTGPKGDPGPRGPNGTVTAFTKRGIDNPIATPTTTYTSVLKLDLPAGRYVILGRAHLGQGGQAQYSGFCRLYAGNETDGLGVQGTRNPTVGGVGSGANVFLTVIQEFTSAGVADLRCWSPAGAPTTVSSPQITAIAITPTAIASTAPAAKAGG